MNKQHLLGVDIGGTKCAVTYGCGTDGHLDILDKERFATTTCQETVENLIQALKQEGNEWVWYEKDVNPRGGNEYHTEKICDNFWYYRLSY